MRCLVYFFLGHARKSCATCGHLQNNHICSLKGSLQELKFLQKLDVSGNQLRDLPQVIKLLCGLRHLTHLNLKARPCTAANEDDNSLCVLVAELIIELYLPRSPQLRMGFHPCQHVSPKG